MQMDRQRRSDIRGRQRLPSFWLNFIVCQCFAEVNENFTHTCWLLTLPFGVGTVLQQHIYLALFPLPHAYTYKHMLKTPDHTSQPQTPWE